MPVKLLISIMIGVSALIFIAWVLERELRLHIEDTDITKFLNKWVVKLIRASKKEILVSSGEPCTKLLNENRSVLEGVLSAKSDIKLKMIAGSKKMLSDFAMDLVKVLSNPSIVKKTEMHEMDQNLRPPQHFIIIDGKHMLLSYVDGQGRSYKAISLKRDRKKIKSFRDHFFEMWKEFPSIEFSELI